MQKDLICCCDLRNVLLEVFWAHVEIGRFEEIKKALANCEARGILRLQEVVQEVSDFVATDWTPKTMKSQFP